MVALYAVPWFYVYRAHRRLTRALREYALGKESQIISF